MDWPIRIVRYVIAFAVAYVVTYVLAAFFYTLLVNAELASLDTVDVPLGAYLTGTWDNIVGLNDSIFATFWGAYSGVICVGLAVAFTVAFLLKMDGPFQVSLIGAVAAGVVVAIGVHLLDNQGIVRTLVIGLVVIPVVLGVNLLATRVLPMIKPLAYPLAGAAAVGMVLFLIGWAQGAASMAGARDVGGFILQMAAGGIGGVVFALLRPIVAEDAPASI